MLSPLSTRTALAPAALSRTRLRQPVRGAGADQAGWADAEQALAKRGFGRLSQARDWRADEANVLERAWYTFSRNAQPPAPPASRLLVEVMAERETGTAGAVPTGGERTEKRIKAWALNDCPPRAARTLHGGVVRGAEGLTDCVGARYAAARGQAARVEQRRDAIAAGDATGSRDAQRGAAGEWGRRERRAGEKS